MRIKDKVILKKWPAKLEETARWLKEYPTSLRLANELCEIGMPLIKQNSLYLPFIRYAAKLYFQPPDENISACLSFQRITNGLDYIGLDCIGMRIVAEKERMFVEVHRISGARAYAREGEYKNLIDYLKAGYGNAPFTVRTHKYSAENKLVEYTNHDLLFGGKPETIKVVPSPDDLS